MKKLSLKIAKIKKSLEKQIKKKAYYKVYATKEALSKSLLLELRRPLEDKEVETTRPVANIKGKLLLT